MGLPFLDKKRMAASLAMAMKGNSPEIQEENTEEPDMSLEACAEELLHAIHSKDAKLLAEAIKSMFIIVDSMPHEEGEHI